MRISDWSSDVCSSDLFRKDLALDQAVALKLTQGLGQHFLADPVEPFAEPGETDAALFRQRLDHPQAPAIADAHQHFAHQFLGPLAAGAGALLRGDRQGGGFGTGWGYA